MRYRQPTAKFVLVVEEDPIARINAVNMLENAGYEVLEAGSANDALHLLEARGDEVVGLFASLHRQARWMGSS